MSAELLNCWSPHHRTTTVSYVCIYAYTHVHCTITLVRTTYCVYIVSETKGWILYCSVYAHIDIQTWRFLITIVYFSKPWVIINLRNAKRRRQEEEVELVSQQAGQAHRHLQVLFKLQQGGGRDWQEHQRPLFSISWPRKSQFWGGITSKLGWLEIIQGDIQVCPTRLLAQKTSIICILEKAILDT